MTSTPTGRQGFRRDEKEILEQGPPIDFSFRHASTLEDVKNDRPRAFRVGHMPMRGGSMKYLTRSIWLNNNNLTNARGFETFANHLLEQPSALGWIDLSFNTLTEIDNEILKFPNLRILYLHGNSIQSLMSIEKLKKLDRLITITFHGNPIESIPSYRSYIISMLPQICNLDFAPVVPAEREAVPPVGMAKNCNSHTPSYEESIIKTEKCCTVGMPTVLLHI